MYDRQPFQPCCMFQLFMVAFDVPQCTGCLNSRCSKRSTRRHRSPPKGQAFATCQHAGPTACNTYKWSTVKPQDGGCTTSNSNQGPMGVFLSNLAICPLGNLDSFSLPTQGTSIGHTRGWRPPILKVQLMRSSQGFQASGWHGLTNTPFLGGIIVKGTNCVLSPTA